jgi:ABC-type branched-subunit amino acid transport system ATPase component/predicted MFS family arabinose efflux permease
MPVVEGHSDEATPSPAAARFAERLLALDNDNDRADAKQPRGERELPGVGAEPMSLRDGLERGGRATFVILLLLVAFEELEGQALTVLAPDIRDAFGISDGAIAFMISAAGAFIVLGSLPMGLLADRFRRGRIIGAAAAFFGLMVAASGLAANAFLLFWARAGVGAAKSATNTVHGSLLGDQYPIGVRGRVSSANQMAATVVRTASPLIAGAIATAAGGAQGWRWAFAFLGIPTVVVAFLALRLPEPPRGQYEKLDVLGELVQDEEPAPVSIEAGFARIMQIRTMKYAILAFAVLGFGLFIGPVLASLHLDRQFDAKSFSRGVLGTVGGIPVLIALPFVGRYFDRLYRTNPAKALALIGWLVLPTALFTPLQYLMPNKWSFAIAGIPSAVLNFSAFSIIGPVLQSVVPYRLRGIGAAVGAVYIFFIGAVGGGFLSFLFLDSIGLRATVFVIIVPSVLIGAFLLIRSSHFIRDDLAMIADELHDELDEAQRRKADPSTVPALQVHDVDFSYGQMQVLFGVSFEVAKGEVLALLGTNGAGKSTALRAIAGLGMPSRGTVRLNGRNVTFATPEQRAKLGIQLLPGGKGVFPDATVRDNLLVGGFALRHDPKLRDARIRNALDLFPILEARLDQRASSLSGGQQQMLALARVLLHEPEVLIIDELSLGLAPIVVQDLLRIVDQLKQRGMTIILVEQSLNVALAIADRAVFMEKGRVRFDGAPAELAERGDLARAVFLGTEDG